MKICSCGNDTNNLDGVCDICKLLDEENENDD